MHGFTPHRILVPVNGASTDDGAITLGCRFARREKAKVFAITVLEVKRSLALDAVEESELERVEGILARVEATAAELEVSLVGELLQAREAGPAIVDEVRDRQADLLVLGMPFRQRFGEFHMGRSVPYVLRYAPCRVLLFREPPP